MTSYTYDAANRKVTETDPLGRVVTFSYDGVGNVIRRVNAADNESPTRTTATDN